MKVAAGHQVTVHVELLDERGGALAESEPEHVRYRHGEGELLPGIERALEGASEGDELSIDLAPEDAFGPYEPEGLFSVPREEFGETTELERGAWVTISVAAEEGDQVDDGELEARISEILDEEVVLDANHPLAGRRLTARVRVLGIEA